MDNKIILSVAGFQPLIMTIKNEPKSEKELLQYPEYTEWYYKIGLVLCYN